MDQSYNGKVIWQDAERKLFFEGEEPVLLYRSERYTFNCQPYEPMLIILGGRKGKVFVHNAFLPDEDCRCFLDYPHFLVRTISGRHHDAERFCRLFTTAIDWFSDCQLDEVEDRMLKCLVQEKGVGAVSFEARDFVCGKILYEGVYVMLGYFENDLGWQNRVGRIYSIAFGFPRRNADNLEYYLLSGEEYERWMQQPGKRRWKDNDEADEWYRRFLAGRKQLLCNEFSRNDAHFKPLFTLSEIPAGMVEME